MRLTDELKEARVKIETAMGEQSRHDDARCASAGKRHMLQAAAYDVATREITHPGDQEPAPTADQ
jgi:hypothetical protein